jgi:atypical dual specificity phosphatase
VNISRDIAMPSSPYFDWSTFSRIDDRIFLSGFPSQEAIDSNGITHVINVTQEPANYNCGHILNIPIGDRQDVPINEYFDLAHEFIQNALDSDGTVLVHCYAGISRSATILISYFMKTRNMNSADAFEYVRARRPIVSPNMGFRGILIMYEGSLGTQ